MQVKVHMLAFCDKGTIRKVDIPDDEIEDSLTSDSKWALDSVLNLVFRYGQNMFQSRSTPSVSVGDVIELDGKYHEVKTCGFTEVTKEEFDEMDSKRAMEAYFG